MIDVLSPRGHETDPDDRQESWSAASVLGWRLWLSGGWGWRGLVVGLLALHVSFLPWPPVLHQLLGGVPHRHASSPWVPTAWDTHQFADRLGADFFGIYEAGFRVLIGMDPYSVNTDRTPRGSPTDFAAFRYVPITAFWLAAPLALLPPYIAYGFWIGLNEFLLLFNLGLTSRWAPERSRRVLGAAWLVFFPLHVEWHMGQFSFLMGCLLFWTGLALAQRRAWAAVTFWGISTWLKNWTVIFAPYWLLQKNKGPAVASILWVYLLAVTTAGYFLVSPQSLPNFTAHATRGRTAAGVDDLYWGRQGVQMLPAVLIAEGQMPEDRAGQGITATDRASDPAAWVNAFLSLASLGVIVAAFVRYWQGRGSAARHVTESDSWWWRWKAGACPLPVDLLALVWLWWFFAYVDTWEHHYVMILPLMALLGLTGRLTGIHWWIPALTCGLPSLWTVLEQVYAIGDPSRPFWVVLYFVQRPIGVIWVFAVLSVRVLRWSGAGEVESDRAAIGAS